MAVGGGGEGASKIESGGKKESANVREERERGRDRQTDSEARERGRKHSPHTARTCPATVGHSRQNDRVPYSERCPQRLPPRHPGEGGVEAAGVCQLHPELVVRPLPDLPRPFPEVRRPVVVSHGIHEEIFDYLRLVEVEDGLAVLQAVDEPLDPGDALLRELDVVVPLVLDEVLHLRLLDLLLLVVPADRPPRDVHAELLVERRRDVLEAQAGVLPQLLLLRLQLLDAVRRGGDGSDNRVVRSSLAFRRVGFEDVEPELDACQQFRCRWNTYQPGLLPVCELRRPPVVLVRVRLEVALRGAVVPPDAVDRRQPDVEEVGNLRPGHRLPRLVAEDRVLAELSVAVDADLVPRLPGDPLPLPDQRVPPRLVLLCGRLLLLYLPGEELVAEAPVVE